MSECRRKLETDILVGGQAVLEGVMMRTPNTIAVAVRRPDGEIVVKREPAPKWTDRARFLKWPLVRGTAILLQSLVIGIKALNFSAEVAMAEPAEDGGQREKGTSTAGGGSQWMLVGTLVFSLAAGIALFVLVPYWLSALITAWVYPAESTDAAVHAHWLFFNLVDGVIRVIFFLGYILLIAQTKDIHRVFQYHGAEHKVVHLWEAKQPLGRARPRLFHAPSPLRHQLLLFVMVISILVFTVFKFDWWVFKVLSRVFLLPHRRDLVRTHPALGPPAQSGPQGDHDAGPGAPADHHPAPDDAMLEVSLRALQEGLELEAQLKEAAEPAAVA